MSGSPDSTPKRPPTARELIERAAGEIERRLLSQAHVGRAKQGMGPLDDNGRLLIAYSALTEALLEYVARQDERIQKLEKQDD